jgi:hypothetical protein
MPRVYLPLLPLPVLAVLVAISACTKAKSEEVSHVIPPAAVAALTTAEKPAAPPEAGPAAAKDAAPSAEEVKEFERPVRK